MTKIDIFSGFLGAGKTTLLKKLIAEAYAGQKLVLIENEFGEIGIDGGFMQDAGINVTEMNSGCICCSLVGDFGEALKKVLDEYAPDRILIEPSGVGKLSDVIAAVQKVESDKCVLNAFTTVVDANKCKMYMKNFGEFFDNQIQFAGSIILSHTAGMSEAKLADCVERLRTLNAEAAIVTTDWESITGAQILDVIEHRDTLHDELEALAAEHAEHHHHHHDHDEDCCCCHDHEHEHHHHHDHDEDCCCHDHDHEHHHHDHDEDCGCCCHDHEHEHHHHHDHDEDCCCHDHEHEHEHHHHHDHDEDCGCGCHDHEHHHHADEVFTSWGKETTRKFTEEEITGALEALEEESKYGMVLRAKGIVPAADGSWIHFDYVPGEPDVRHGSAGVTGRLCVIGAQISEEALEELFGL